MNRYRVRWRSPDGRSRSQTFDKKVDADRHLTSVQHSKLDGSYVDPGAGRLTMDEWIPIWRAGVVDLRPSTLARDDGYIERYISPTFGSKRLVEIDHPMVTAWVAEMVATGPIPWWDIAEEPKRKRRPLSPATVTKCGQILGKIMTAAVAAGRLKSSPCVGVKLPRIEREEMRFLTPSEITALADAIDGRYRAMVLLGAYGGLRVGEIFGLRAKRVDVLRARVDVAEILVEVSGNLHFGPPKTRAGRRAVPLPRVATEALSEHLKSFPAAKEDLVFRSSEGDPSRLSNWRHRVWEPAVKAAGLEHLRPHDLRHTAVALWIAAGASPNEVAARAGHSSVVTVLDRYGHLLPGSDDKVNDALDALATAESKTASISTIG
ncbi:MAG: tyrosine-type recombinase/integrase [Acidimicrobiales bacterium]